jgi:D-glycero-alpha-D-manno-heptose-7-phosphate kinase
LIAVGEIMRRAYPNRKRLAPNITTPQMDALVETALANGAEAAKVCGAGGGGCIAFCAPKDERRMSREPWRAAAGRGSIKLESSAEGLMVTES